MKTTREVSFFVSLLPIVLLLVLIMGNVLGTDVDSLGGANQLSLFLAALFASIIGVFYGKTFDDIIGGISAAFSSAIPAMIILLMVGLISGSWVASGVIPAMIYYGLDLLDADYFLPVVVIMSSIVSLITGSSWGTVATVGVAFIGIGKALGFADAWVAGAIISGAYFGDKISPLSDTTNLAAAIVEEDVFDHIRFMLKTTTPSLLLTLVIFSLMSFFLDISPCEVTLPQQFQTCIGSTFVISPWLLLVPVLTIAMIVKKFPAPFVLFISSIVATLIAFFVQKEYLSTIGDMSSVQNVYNLLTSILYGQVVPHTGLDTLDSLFATSGMSGMINTIWLIISAMVFAGVMTSCGFLEKITQTIIKLINSRFSMVSSTVASCLLFNVTAGDQYMSILIPGKMFLSSYKKIGCRPLLLSRTLEDSATVTSPLIPWNTCGATQASVLHVSTFTYAPFAFFCWISPLMTLLFAMFSSKHSERNTK